MLFEDLQLGFEIHQQFKTNTPKDVDVNGTKFFLLNQNQTRWVHLVRGSSGSYPAIFFLKILLSRTPFINFGGVMVRRHFPNLALPIFDVAPPSTLI